MKKLFFWLFAAYVLFNFQSARLYAQVAPPEGIIYQAEARDSKGNLLKKLPLKSKSLFWLYHRRGILFGKATIILQLMITGCLH